MKCQFQMINFIFPQPNMAIKALFYDPFLDSQMIFYCRFAVGKHPPAVHQRRILSGPGLGANLMRSPLIYVVLLENSKRSRINLISRHFFGFILRHPPCSPNRKFCTKNKKPFINYDKESMLFLFSGPQHRKRIEMDHHLLRNALH